MDSRIGIFVGSACHKPHAEFTKSLSDFLVSCSLKYDIECLSVYGKELVDAQNQIAERFLKTDKQFLLMVEDDNWGFTLEMLDALVEADKPVIGIKYFSRHSPHVVLPMRPLSLNKGLMELIGPVGVIPVYLVGFGMTLIKRMVFENLEEPYFALNENAANTPCHYATDHNFCHRLMSAGIAVFGHYDYCLTHRGLNLETIEKAREKMLANSFIFNLRVRDNIRREKCLK